MRKRPEQKKLEEEFINSARAFQDDAVKSAQEPSTLSSSPKGEGLMQMDWPILGATNLKYEEGSTLRKPVTLPLKEYEWNTLNEHIKRLGVSKSEWIRYAMFATMERERAILNNE